MVNIFFQLRNYVRATVIQYNIQMSIKSYSFVVIMYYISTLHLKVIAISNNVCSSMCNKQHVFIFQLVTY